MKKYILLFIILTFICQGILSKSYTLNNYSYQEVNSSQNNINISSSSDEEVLFIMDFSGSMQKKLGYTPKIYLAIDALRDIMSEVGASTKIGLRIFGVTDKRAVERVGNKLILNEKVLCTASSLVMPIARYNSSNISNKLSKYSPKGATPIGYSLRQAVQNDFSPNAPLKHIILISDGVENCGDDPCLFIRNLMQLRDDYKIDVIGITVDENAFSQLKCIANAAKGNYYSVNSPSDFKVKFKEALNSTHNIKPNFTMPQVKMPEEKQIIDDTKYKNYTFEFFN